MGGRAIVASPVARWPSRWPTWRSVEQRSNGLFLEENRKIFIRCSVAHTKWGCCAHGPSSPRRKAHGGRRIYSSLNLSKVLLGSVKASLTSWKRKFASLPCCRGGHSRLPHRQQPNFGSRVRFRRFRADSSVERDESSDR